MCGLRGSNGHKAIDRAKSTQMGKPVLLTDAEYYDRKEDERILQGCLPGSFKFNLMQPAPIASFEAASKAYLATHDLVKVPLYKLSQKAQEVEDALVEAGTKQPAASYDKYFASEKMTKCEKDETLDPSPLPRRFSPPHRLDPP